MLLFLLLFSMGSQNLCASLQIRSGNRVHQQLKWRDFLKYTTCICYFKLSYDIKKEMNRLRDRTKQTCLKGSVLQMSLFGLQATILVFSGTDLTNEFWLLIRDLMEAVRLILNHYYKINSSSSLENRSRFLSKQDKVKVKLWMRLLQPPVITILWWFFYEQDKGVWAA